MSQDTNTPPESRASSGADPDQSDTDGLDATMGYGASTDGEEGPTSPAPGTLIERTYRVIGPLGEGGMGVVLLARDERLERDVAIKLIRHDFVSSTGARDRFLAEARAMARVRHENVVEIYAFGEHDGTPYFAMEYVPGPTVAAWLRPVYDEGAAPPPIDEVLGILDQVCRGVAAIHSTGAIHRDIKPSNVLIGPAFRAAIADLGLARRARSADEGPSVVGTPGYMAPELLTLDTVADELANRVDIYSLGVLAYELLTGQRPFQGRGLAAMLKQQTESVAPPSEKRHDLPSVFDAPLLGSMRRDPRQRTGSAEIFRRELFEARELMAQVASRPVRILVADDDADFRALAAETLLFAFEGADIECVEDGEAALRAVDRRPPALAVIDLKMPGMNGIELTAALCGGERETPIKVIVVTAHGGAPDWRLLQVLGADGFLVKPIDPYALVTLARRTLAPHGEPSRKTSMRRR